MLARSRLASAAHEALVVLLSTALVIAPFGCQLEGLPFQGSSPTGDTGQSQTTGLFVNPDVSDPLLVAARNAAGDEFFIFGQRSASGGIDPAKIESIVVRTADGKEAVLAFESGRPVFFEAPDGTTVKVKYTEIETNYFDVTLTVYLASTGETTTYAGKIDLRQIISNAEEAARNAVAVIKQYTGVEIALPAVDDIPTEKSADRALGFVVKALIILPIAMLLYVSVVALSQVLTLTVAAAIESATEAVEVAIVPLFDFASIFSETAFRVEIRPLFDLFIAPIPPVIVIN